MVSFGKLLQVLSLTASAVAVAFDTGNKTSICAAAKAVADGEWNYYEGIQYGGTVGMFVAPYYWWHAGEAFGGLLDYFTFCDPTNTTLKKLIFDGMYAQAGAQYNYVPSNQSLVEGNDDQGVWGLTIMEAVERNFTDPEEHSWLSLTQAIYNTMYARWDTGTCGGGLRWQIFTWNSGYDYKNTIANGCLFHIAARLARYTGNQTYADVAEKVWDWMEDVSFINYSGADGGMVLFDGSKVGTNCEIYTQTKWSYTYGIVMSGCAYLYSFDEDDKWLNRTKALVKASSYYFNGSIMYEASCAPGHCNNDQRTFRSLFARGLALTAVLVNDTSDQISDWLEASAIGAAGSCSGGSDGVTCGENWSVPYWDGYYGLGEQMGALETMLGWLQVSNRVVVKAPYTTNDGGSSTSSPNAGLDTTTETNSNLLVVSTKDKAGAGVLTAVVLLIILGGAAWMVF